MISYLQVDELTKSFGNRILFEDISFGLAEGQRVGLIAKNGSGKSTLLSILSGKEGYDDGKITFRRMKNQIMIAYFNIIKVARRDPLDVGTAVDIDIQRLPGGEHPHDLVHQDGKREIPKGLYHIADSADFISLHRILHHARHKDKDHIGIELAQLERAVHPVHIRHFNIHKDHVVLRRIIADEVHAV